MNPEHQHNNYEDKSGSEMLSEIGHLLWKLCLKVVAHLLKIILKGLMFCFAMLKLLLQACIDFWNDNSTQEKLRMARQWCINSIKLCGSYCLMGLIAIGKGLVWTAKAAWKGITHLKPTLVFLGRLCSKAAKATWRGLIVCGKAIRIFFLKRQQAFRRFRRNKGFKGLLIDIKTYLQEQLNSYMDDNDTVSSDAISYDEYIDANRSDGKPSFGKKIYKEMDKFFDN
ncbi:MAG: hypothetical protein J5770_04860 [Bacteroidaceae bacterium]|nr:hypothetical protein [Bacteroidaceae bacterium]